MQNGVVESASLVMATSSQDSLFRTTIPSNRDGDGWFNPQEPFHHASRATDGFGTVVHAASSS
jgi:hypothetical protein